MDRMEMSRGSAMLKSDIEREVEITLEEHLKLLFPLHEVKPADPKCMITPTQAQERGIPMGAAGYIWVDDIEPGTIFGSPDE